MKTTRLFLSALASLVLAFGSGSSLRAADHDKAHGDSWSAVRQVVAVLYPTAGNKCRGEVRFTQEGDKVKVVAKVEGLTPGQKHAIHIHQFGDATSTDGSSAGGHYNPEGHAHGLPEAGMRHAGDLGNLQADAEGRCTYELTVSNISVAGLKNPIVGRGVIVHAKPDDGGQPVGNAGARIAMGVIGVATTGK